MKRSIELDFAERRKAANDAKKRLLEKLAPALEPNAPDALVRRAEKVAAAEARDRRREERDRLKREAAEREKAEAVTRAEAEAATLILAKGAEAERLAAEELERKSERDRRYAARKARKR
jgi:glycine/D-amino acid oxidase-like deaminating enzyme